MVAHVSARSRSRKVRSRLPAPLLPGAKSQEYTAVYPMRTKGVDYEMTNQKIFDLQDEEHETCLWPDGLGEPGNCTKGCWDRALSRMKEAS